MFEVQKLETCISVIKTRKSLGSFKYLNLSESLNHNIRSQLVSNYLPTYKRSATLGTLFSTSASFNRMRQSTAFVVCILYFVLKVWYILKYIWGSLKSLHIQVQQAAVQSVIIQEEMGNGFVLRP